MTNKDFVKFCLTAKDKPVKYMWGTYGQKITDKLIASKTIQYPDHYPQSYQDELHAAISGGGIACDCTGLIKWFLWTGGDIEKAPKYDGATDNSASGWYKSAKIKGEIGTIPLDRKGLILWKSGHCGVYIGDGNVIECTKGQFGNGVVQTRLLDRQWTHWCECKYIDYTIEKPTAPTDALSGKPARVSKDCNAYADMKLLQKVGSIDVGDEIEYLGKINGVAAVIYPTAATRKIAFVAESLVVLNATK